MIKVVFMGTPDFAVPTLQKLCLDDDIDVSLVVTKKDTKAKRGNKLISAAVKIASKKLNINVVEPDKIKDDREVIEQIKSIRPDFIIVVAYGQILSKEILDIPKIACINGHASLLPKYRGASPIQSSILNGDEYTGITTMLMDTGLDTGDILMQQKLYIEKKYTSEDLFEKLSVITADTILTTIKNYDKIDKKKQNESETTKSSIIKKEYGEIDLENETNIEVERKIRAYYPWPSAYLYIDGIMHKIYDSDVIEDDKKYDLL